MPRPCYRFHRGKTSGAYHPGPKRPDIIPALKACGRTRDIDTANKLHLDALAASNDLYVETSLITMYAKCGSMAEARGVFDAMSRHNAVSWTALISGYTGNRDPDSAIAAFHSMQASGCETNSTTFVAAINALCSKIEREKRQQQLGQHRFAQMPEKGICSDTREAEMMTLIDTCVAIHAQSRQHDSDVFVPSALLDMYAKLGSVYDARVVFDQMPCHDVVSWTVLILAYVDAGDHHIALDLFHSMPPGCDPDAMTFVAAIVASSSLAASEAGVELDDQQGKVVKLESLERCRALHSLAVEKGFADDIFVASKLVDTYSKSGSVDEAWQVFQSMPRRDVVAWSSMVMGLAENGQGYRALDCFRCLEQSLEPDSGSFTAAITAAASLAAEEKPGREIEGKLVKLGALARGMELHARAEGKRYCGTDLCLLNSLIGFYSKCGCMADARRVFDKMPAYTAVSWSSLILGYVENGDDDLALEIFQRMKHPSHSIPSPPPCERSYVAAVMACASSSSLDTGRRLHREICLQGMDRGDYLSVALVDLYAKCGSMEEAETAFRRAATKNKTNKVAWSALLAGYSRQGDADNVFATFDRMRSSELEPCGVVFLLLLTACSHAGLVDRGRQIFTEMVDRYRISPLVEHHNCMVDMLGRANRLDEALDMATNGPFAANAATWKIVLGSCQKARNVPVASVAFEALVGIDPKLDIAYVVMAAILGSAGLWEEQACVLERRRKAGTWRKSGQSWWECPKTGVVHRFRAGDASQHPQGAAIAAKLAELLEVMKVEYGYVAATGCVSHNISEGEKEGTLCSHSERLAIACALVNTGRGEVVRIAKNLRVCEDCHRATGIISRIEKRVIVCRDTNRFHVFEDGECSCRNYW